MASPTKDDRTADQICQLNAALGSNGTAGRIVETGEWLIEWTMGEVDPFTGENHRTTYPTFAAALAAAESVNT